MNFVKLLCLFILSLTVWSRSYSQVYAGGGFVYTSLSKSGLDDVSGFGIEIQKEIRFNQTKLSIIPRMHLTVLHSNVFRQVNAFYANTISLAPTISYKIIETDRISISPFASPFMGWLFAYRDQDLFFDNGYRNEAIYGLEFGMEFTVRLYQFLEVKIDPITLQIGDNDFRQGMISLVFRLSK